MYRLIIVDDEHEIRNGLADYFPWAELGYEVAGVFENGVTAMDYLSGNQVEVVLTDIKMPGVSGIDLARFIQEHHPEIMVVFLSGYADFSYARSAIEYGVRFYAVKPTVHQELFDVFTKVRLELDKSNADKGKPEQGPGGTYNGQIIDKVKSHVKERHGAVTLETAAAHVDMNAYYLSSFFKLHTGIKFIDYVLGVRMRHAAELLRNPAYRIFEVSLELGYRNANNFGRAFKSYFGVSPREYRSNGFQTFRVE